MEAALATGLTKSIGVSNFNKEQLQRLIENSKVKPTVNQVEVSNLKLGVAGSTIYSLESNSLVDTNLHRIKGFLVR